MYHIVENFLSLRRVQIQHDPLPQTLDPTKTAKVECCGGWHGGRRLDWTSCAWWRRRCQGDQWTWRRSTTIQHWALSEHLYHLNNPLVGSASYSHLLTEYNDLKSFKYFLIIWNWFLRLCFQAIQLLSVPEKKKAALSLNIQKLKIVWKALYTIINVLIS